MRDVEYTFAVARIRVLEKHLLSDDDISAMISLKDVPAVVVYLLDRGWGDGSQQDPDRLLAAEASKTLDLMRELKVDPEIFRILTYPRYFHNLKAAIKELCTEVRVAGAYYELEDFGRERLLELLREKDYRALPEDMQKVAAEAYETMASTQDGQICDLMVDRACLDAMMEIGRKNGSSLIRAYEEMTVAVTDIRIAYRAARTGKSLRFLREGLAECDSISVSALADAASRGSEELLTFLRGAGYGQAADAIEEGPSAFDRWCDNRLIETLKPQKTNTISVGPLVAYYLAKENEIKSVRILLTAKANGFPEEAIRGRVREMYG